jgi:hypothetical protein
MKSKNRFRAISFPTGALGMGDRYLNSVSTPSASGQRQAHARKIFIIRQTKAMRTTSGSAKKIRRVVIFDNHPATLRLLFGRRTNPRVDLSRPQPASVRELALVWTLVAVLLMAMFWPLL